MELRRLLNLIRQRKLLLAFMVLAALAAGYGVTSRTALYVSTTTLYVGVPEYSSAGAYSADLQTGQDLLAATFTRMVATTAVAEAALAATPLPRTAGQVVGEMSASVVTGTSLISLSVTDPDPVVAQTLATSVATAFVAQVEKIDPIASTLTGKPIANRSPVSVSEPAGLPLAPRSDGLTRTLVLSGLFGLVAGVGLALLLDYLDLSVRTPEDLEERLGLPVLGIVPLNSRLASGRAPLVVGAAPPALVDDRG